jgi:hypothetical protein
MSVGTHGCPMVSVLVTEGQMISDLIVVRRIPMGNHGYLLLIVTYAGASIHKKQKILTSSRCLLIDSLQVGWINHV